MRRAKRTKQLRRWWTTLLVVALLLPLAAAVARAEGDDWDDDDEGGKAPAVELHGFVEAGASGRLVDDPTTRDEFTMGEARFRLEVRHEREIGALSFKGDLLADGLTRGVSVDVREALVTFSPWSFLDVKIGRQVLTWGTGDLLFLNDMFPKDWVSFFIGRDDEYLKAPSNTLKVSFFVPKAFNVDVAWTPLYEPDRFVTGERLSFYNPMAGAYVGGAVVVDPQRPDFRVRDSELAGRIYRTVGGFELAGYGYLGKYKQPLGFDPAANVATFPALGVYGASVRGPLLGGVFNLEGAFHHSIDDEDGRDPMVPNHQLRGLVGYEHELAAKMTLGLQYYLEYTLQHDRLVASSPMPALEQDQARHVATLRWRYMLLRDDLTLSLFAFVSPSDKDAYLRPAVHYKVADGLKLSVGANIVLGDEDQTFFARMQKNSNVYARARYTF